MACREFAGRLFERLAGEVHSVRVSELRARLRPEQHGFERGLRERRAGVACGASRSREERGLGRRKCAAASQESRLPRRRQQFVEGGEVHVRAGPRRFVSRLLR